MCFSRALLPQRVKLANEAGTGASASVQVGHPLTPTQEVSACEGLRSERRPSQSPMPQPFGPDTLPGPMWVAGEEEEAGDSR